MNARKYTVLRLLTAAVCLAYLTPPNLRAAADSGEPMKEKMTVTTRFLTHDQLRTLAKSDPEMQTNLKAAWPELYEGRESVAGALGAGLVVWAGKQVWAGIANLFKEASKKHKGEFGAVGSAVNKPAALGLEYAALELRRDQYEPDTKNLFRCVLLLRQDNSEPNLATYQLIPVYWRETKSVAKLSGSEKMLTASLTVTLNAIWRDGQGVPRNAGLISAQWALEKYRLNMSVIPPVELIEAGPDKLPVQVKGLPPSRSFVVPGINSLLIAELKVTEVDASKAAAILDKIAEAMESQADNIGTIIENGLD